MNVSVDENTELKRRIEALKRKLAIYEQALSEIALPLEIEDLHFPAGNVALKAKMALQSANEQSDQPN